LSFNAADVDKPTKGAIPILLNLSCVTVATGRPDLCAMLQDEAEGARGPMSVSGRAAFFTPHQNILAYLDLLVCGSESVANAVRSALQSPVAGPIAILKGGPSITLHVESFGYA
jgi:ferric-chelate reductase